ncbi:MAG: Lrp/AsnC ligand binding domain-containing protein [Acinetobacter sp.]|nr:Lrp/AsnC ligand binding domain-containing protein [Acinetobacter sp.]
MIIVDRIDLKILTILQDDARISNIKLAEKVNLSPTAVLARVQRLNKEGYIQGYEARLNPSKMNAGFLVFAQILLDRTTSNALHEFKTAVMNSPQIIECHMMSGGFDFMVKIRCQNMEEYRKIADELLWQLPGVKETRSYPVIEQIKESAKIFVM